MENKIVTLLQCKPQYKSNNLYPNVQGIIIKEISQSKSLVLFFNDKIVGDYAVVEVNNEDIKVENLKLPAEMSEKLTEFNLQNYDKINKKTAFEKLAFNECDFVELLTEDEKYSKYGIHKGYTGVVAIDYAVNNSILIDFSGVDKKGKYYGDCISVKLSDIKKLDK